MTRIELHKANGKMKPEASFVVFVSGTGARLHVALVYNSK